MGSSAVFLLLLGGGLLALAWLLPSIDVALAAGAAWFVFLLLVVAAWDLVAMADRRLARSLAWLPQWPLGGWLDPVRGSLVVIAFVYGILLGHYFWR